MQMSRHLPETDYFRTNLASLEDDTDGQPASLSERIPVVPKDPQNWCDLFFILDILSNNEAHWRESGALVLDIGKGPF